MKELTANERVSTGILWDNGYSTNSIAAIIQEKRNNMDMCYLAKMVEDELEGRVGIAGEGTD